MIIPASRSPCDEPSEDSLNGLLCESDPLKLIDALYPLLPSHTPSMKPEEIRSPERIWYMPLPACMYVTNGALRQRPIDCNGCRGCGAVIQPRPGTNVAPLPPLPHWDSVSKGSEEENCIWTSGTAMLLEEGIAATAA